jgi:PEGA domain-containing protein/type III secretion system (T3SS) inner membrane Yop/CscD-like protein
VIERALAKDPADRFQSCREMSHALQNYHGVPQSSSSGTPTVRLPSKAPFPAVVPAAHRTGSRPALNQNHPPNYAPRHAPLPARISTGTIAWQTEQPRKRNRHIALALALLGLIAVAGYHIWPVLNDFWLTGVKPTLDSHLAPFEREIHSSHPASAPAPSPAPAAHAPSAKPSASRPAAGMKPASAAPAAPASSDVSTSDPSSAAETPIADRAETDPSPTAAASVVAKRLGAFLASAGLSSTVQVHAAGDTLTLSGSLTPAQYQSLLHSLRDVPADVHIVDHIEAGGDSPDAAASPAPAPVTHPSPAVARASTPAPASSAAAAPSLSVTSQPPGANIFVNGQRQFAQTPAKIDLPPGAYRIAVGKPGFEPYAAQVEIQPGKTARLDAQLSPLAQGQGWVVVRTIPKGASIAVDGVPMQQQTPARVELAAGQHLIVFSIAGYSGETSVYVRPGKGSQVFQILNRP